MIYLMRRMDVACCCFALQVPFNQTDDMWKLMRGISSVTGWTSGQKTGSPFKKYDEDFEVSDERTVLAVQMTWHPHLHYI